MNVLSPNEFKQAVSSLNFRVYSTYVNAVRKSGQFNLGLLPLTPSKT